VWDSEDIFLLGTNTLQKVLENGRKVQLAISVHAMKAQEEGRCSYCVP